MAAPFRSIPVEELRPNAWYYGWHCDCGLQVVVHEAAATGFGNGRWELPRELPLECECGRIHRVRHLEKFRIAAAPSLL